MRDLTADDMPIFGELTDEERGALIRAEKEGKKVQKFHKTFGWEIWLYPKWKWNTRYRIKPEPRKPREIWVHEYKDGIFGVAWKSSEEAQKHFNNYACRSAIKFREVIDNE